MRDGDAARTDDAGRCAYCWKPIGAEEGLSRGKQLFCSAACLQRDPSVALVEDESLVSAEQAALW